MPANMIPKRNLPASPVPIDFNLYPQAVPPIGPEDKSPVAPKPGGSKSMPSLPQPAPSKSNASWLRQHGKA